MAGPLASCFVDSVEFTNAGSGALTCDVNWTGQANSVDLARIRARWIARQNGASAPAPLQSTAAGYAETNNIATVGGGFQYIDRTSTNPSRAESGTQSVTITVTQTAFANKTVWVMARLEVT